MSDAHADLVFRLRDAIRGENAPDSLSDVAIEAGQAIEHLTAENDALREWQRIVSHMEQPSMELEPCPACDLHHPNGWACPKYVALLRARIPELERGIDEYHEKWTAQERELAEARKDSERLKGELLGWAMHGCLTGDCPHDNANTCLSTLSDSIDEIELSACAAGDES